MLTRLELEDFQPHEKTAIDFTHAVTAIIGPTDIGKSSVIRALRWVMLNSGRAESLIRHGTKGTRVKLYFDDCVIGRERSTSENLYTMGDEVYKAFGVNVPETIADKLNVSPANFQLQHEAAYWLSATGGEVSRQLNAVVDLGIIDDALAYGIYNQKACNEKEVTAKETLKKARETAEALAWVQQAAVGLQGVKTAQEAAQQAILATAKLNASVDAIRKAEAAATLCGQAAAAMLAVAVKARTAARIKEQIATLKEDIKSVHQNTVIINRDGVAADALLAVAVKCRKAYQLREPRQALQTCIERIRQCQSIKAPTIVEMNTLDGCYNATVETRRARFELEAMIANYHVAKQTAALKEKAAAAAEAKFEAVAKVCPLCGKPMGRDV